MKTGNTQFPLFSLKTLYKPQWSPVMKTGNTVHHRREWSLGCVASMEPGHEDREYKSSYTICEGDTMASMEPGHEDREY